MGMPVCSHCTSISLLTELFTAQMERDPALYNSPTETGRGIFNHRNLQTVSLFTFDFLPLEAIFFLLYSINKLFIQASFLVSTPQQWTCCQQCNKSAATQCRRCVMEDVSHYFLISCFILSNRS